MPALFRALAAGLVTGLVLSSCAGAPPEPAAKPKFGTWGIETADMDTSVRPGDDFFDYAVGSWVKKAQIRPDKTCTGVDLDIQDELDGDLKSVVEGAAAEHGPQGGISQQIGDLYASYVDEKALNARGLEPIKPFLTAIDGIVDHAGVDSVMLSFNRLHTSIDDPFPTSPTIDPNDPTRYVPVIAQGGLTLGDRDYYLKQDPDSVALREKFVAHVERILGLAGYTDGHEQALRMLALETKLAEVQLPAVETRDVEKSNNVMSRADVEKLAAGAPLKEMFDAIGYPAQTDMLVMNPDVLAKTARLWAGEPVESWKAYQRYHVLAAYGNTVSTPLANEFFDFYGRDVSGKEEQTPRNKRGIYFVNNIFGDAVGEQYVAEHFSQQTKDQALALVSNLRAAYSARIDKASWMSPETTAEAEKKLAAIVAKIGYPDEYESYAGVRIVPDDLFGNVRALENWSSDKTQEDMRKPVDRTEWGLTPQTNNAYYSARFNDIVFTAAILQPPYFDPAADPAANYGAIGATIGHEMSHAFDDQGRHSDDTGTLRDWWKPADAARYEAETAKLVKQFDAYEPLPGVHVNGALTVGENIADLAGLRIAYDAYELSLNGEDAPVIDGTTGDQRFFLAYAASWKELCRPETQRLMLQGDVHSPEKYRVNGIVRNLDEWYSAFDVKEGDELYLSPGDRVRLW